MLVPYVEISIRDEDGCLNIPDLWVGPTPHPDLSRISIVDFLDIHEVYAYKYQEDITSPLPPFVREDKAPTEKVPPTVQVSAIPYQNW